MKCFVALMWFWMCIANITFGGTDKFEMDGISDTIYYHNDFMEGYNSTGAMFGERNHLPPRKTNVFRLFLDRDGHLYPPNEYIANIDLRKCEGRLIKYYETHQKAWKGIALLEGLPTDFSPTNFNNLQSILRKKFVEQLSPFDNVIFLMHGFHKIIYDKNSAIYDYEGFYDIMNEGAQVEIYWDATSLKFGFLNGKNKKAFRAFAGYSHESADQAAISLSELYLALQNKKQIVFFSHSLGGYLALQTLNQVQKNRNVAKLQAQDRLGKTNVVMLAPAISLDDFNKLGNFNIHSGEFNLIVLVNKRDMVLKKAGLLLWQSCRTYKNTCVACKPKEWKKIKERISKDIKLEIVNMAKEMRTKHSWVKHLTTNSLREIIGRYVSQ